jgi:SAM-dependent methyltransferase
MGTRVQQMFGCELYYSTINPQPKQNRLFYKIYGVMHAGERIRFLHFADVVRREIHSPREILDAGSGNGNYAFYLGRLFPQAMITGIDISKEKIDNTSHIAAVLNVKNIYFDQRSLTETREKGKYDLVVCIDVLEHVRNDSLVLGNLEKSLKPGGALILHVPKNRRLAFRHFKRFRDFRIEDHCREEYTEDEILHKVRHAGFKVKRLSYTQGWFGSLAWEFDQLLIVYGRKLRYVAFPFLYLLILVDLWRRNGKGNGLLLHCLKG